MKKMKNILWIAACTALSSASVAQAAVITVAAGETNDFNEALEVTAVTVDAGGTLNLLGGALWHTGTANANETFVNGDVVVTGGDHRFGSRMVGSGSVSMIGVGGSLLLDELQSNTLEWNFTADATGVSTITSGNWAKFEGGSLNVDLSALGASFNDTLVLFDCKTLHNVFDVADVSISGIDASRYTFDQNQTTDEITLTVIPESANQAPVFAVDPINEANATANVAYSSSIADNASDPNSDPMTFSKVSGPTWLSVASNGDLSGTPSTGDAGANVFTVQVDAIDGTDTATLNITVNATVITVAAGETNNFNEALDVTAVTVDAGGTLNLLGGALWHTGTANANETFVNGDVVVTGGDHRFGSRMVGSGSVSMIGLGGSLLLDELQTNTLEWNFTADATGVSTITSGNWAKFDGGSLNVDLSALGASFNDTLVLFDCKTLVDVFDVADVSITGINEYRYTLDQNLDTDQITLTVTPESGTDVFSASEVINSGTLIEAYNAGGSTSGTNVTVNGVLFIGTSTLLDGNSEADAFLGDTGDAAYNALLSSFDYGGGTDLVSLEVGGGNLTVGTEYTIQVWYVDHLNPGRQTPVGDGESPPSKVVLNSSGQFATSTFVAEASTQTLTLESPGFENAYITAYQIRDPGPGPDWESVMALGDLTNAPIMRANDTNDVTITVSAGETKAIFYDVLDYNGNPTRAYAHLGIPAGASASSQVPAMVLVHGGGQTADDAWVADWTSRGYAAIAISTEGQTDVEATQEQKDAGLAVGKWLRHAMPGPSRSGIYGDSGQDINDQWMYHAVADTILAHSLIRSLPEVNADQTGIMGISWGGVITSTTIGIDDRFQFAIPVFGCGDMDNADNGWGRALKGEPMYEDVWDPTLRLGNVTIPILWFSWPGDPNFPIDRFAVSYRAAPGPRMVTLVPGMGHSTAQATARSDTYAFAESVLSTGLPWCEQRLLSINGDDVSVKFWSSKTLTAASLVSTTNSVVTSDRTWVESSITLQDLGNGLWQASTTLPANTTGWMINVTDGSSIVSSGLQESIYDCGTDISPYIKENGGAWQNTFAASLERGDAIQFAPHPNSGGSWSWNGPNGFSASDRSVAITDLLALDGGNYMATYTDPDGTISRRFFEVNVNGADLNVSVGQSTSQSSTASFGGAAELAVDGDTNGDWSNGSVTQTDPNESNAWWQVDLGSELFIGGIKVYNRTDGNIRLSQFTVSVLDREGSSIFSQSFTGYPDPSILIKTGGVIGQFVRIDQDSNNPLSLAEVEVFESGKAPKFSGWIDQYEVSGDDADPTGDPDGDLLNNLTEFALGGNPTNAASVGFSPMLDASGIESNMVHFVYPRRIGAGSELTYILEFCSDLTSDNWTVGDYVELPETGSLNDDFEAVTNRIDTTGKTKEFMRLRVEMGIPPASG